MSVLDDILGRPAREHGSALGDTARIAWEGAKLLTLALAVLWGLPLLLLLALLP